MLIVGVALAAWSAFYARCLWVTRPRPVPPLAPTRDLGGDEPPAVVDLLVNGWRVTDAAAPATLLDLAARRYVELRQPADDPAQTTVHLRKPDRGELTGYERQVLARVTGLADGAMVPLSALAFFDRREAKVWTRQLTRAVVADARARGLSRRRFSPAMRSTVDGAAVVAACVVGAVVAVHTLAHHGDLRDPVAAWFATLVALGALTLFSNGERDTPAGNATAARWSALRESLSTDENFAGLPPAAVTVWDRYLAYGVALGVNPTCARVVDLGAGSRRTHWSSYGGSWHRVRVHRPRNGWHHGHGVRRLLTGSLAMLGGGLSLVILTSGWADHADLAGAVAGWALVARGGYRLVRLQDDARAPVTVTGEVLDVRVWKTHSQGRAAPRRPWLYRLVVDDGRSGATWWALPAAQLRSCPPGATVRLTARRWSRLVLPRSKVGKIPKKDVKT